MQLFVYYIKQSGLTLLLTALSNRSFINSMWPGLYSAVQYGVR